MATSRSNYPAWIGVALSFYAFIAIGIAEGGLGVLLPSILTTYQLTPATVTLLFISQMSGYITAALTSSLLSSRLGLAKMIWMAAIALTSALSLYAFTTHWPIMVTVGLLLGLGIGLIDAGINTYIASNQRNANLMGMLHAFYGIGALLGPTIATTLLALGLQWRQIYLVIASLVSLLIIGMSWAVLHQYQPMMTSSVAASNSKTNLRRALRMPIVLLSALMLLIYTGVEASIGSWAYTVQHVSRDIPTWVAGYSVSGYWFGLTMGRLAMGQMVRYWGAIRTIDVSLTLLIIGLVTWWQFPDQGWSLPLSGFALAAIFPTIIWLMPQRVPASIVPAAIGFLASIASLGAAAIPSAVGWVADRAGLEAIPVSLLPLAVLMVVIHRGSARGGEKDRREA
ncbi:MFS transporter [Phormidesmis sp. 146-35]